MRLALCAVLALAANFSSAQNCSNTSTGNIPLNDLGAGSYQGFQGGLYSAGSNTPPLAHALGGLAQASEVVPRDAAGNPDPVNGRIGFISIGMSNCVQHFNSFLQIAVPDPLRNPRVTMINCAAGGQTASILVNPSAAYWGSVLQKVQQAGLTAAQVQVVWFLEADAHPTAPFPSHALTLQSEFEIIMGIIRDKYPQTRLCYSASRIYGGYSTTSLHPEPWAYEQAFSVKWMIESQIGGNPLLNYDPALGAIEAPWLGWGPYMWADGLVPRSDGLIWLCSDYQPDGTHPSIQGTQKVAQALLQFVQTDDTARTWYLARPTPVGYGTGKTTSIGTLPTAGWSGEADVGTNAFSVTLAGGVPNKAVVGLWSTNPAQLPFFGGTLWCALPLHRLPPRILDASGATSYAINLTPLMLGTTRCYSFWFRDGAHPDGTGTGLANGLQVRFFD